MKDKEKWSLSFGTAQLIGLAQAVNSFGRIAEKELTLDSRTVGF